MAPVGLTETTVERIRKLSPSGDLNEAERILITILDTAATLGRLLPPAPPSVPGSSSNTTLASTQMFRSADSEPAEQPARKRTRIANDDSGREMSALSGLQDTAADSRYTASYQDGFFEQFSPVGTARLRKQNEINAAAVSPAPTSSYCIPPSVNSVPRSFNHNGSQMPSSTNIGYPSPQGLTTYNNASPMQSNDTHPRSFQLQLHNGVSFQTPRDSRPPRVQVTMPLALPQMRSVDHEPQNQAVTNSLPVTLRLQPEKLRGLVQAMQADKQQDDDETQRTTMTEETMSILGDEKDAAADRKGWYEDGEADQEEVEDWMAGHRNVYDAYLGLHDAEYIPKNNLTELEAAIHRWEVEMALKKREFENWEEAGKEWNQEADDDYEYNVNMYEEQMEEYKDGLYNLREKGWLLRRLKTEWTGTLKESGPHV